MREIDLIPSDIRFLMKWTLRRVAVYMLLVAVLAISIVWRFQLQELKNWERKLRERRNEVASIESKRMEVTELIGKLKEISREKTKFMSTAELIREYSENRINWSDFLAQLSGERFSDLWLNSISLEEGIRKNTQGEDEKVLRLILGGRCFRLDELSRLLESLEKNPLIENVILRQNDRGVVSGKELYTFSIRGEISDEK